jgi:hypothetical protein
MNQETVIKNVKIVRKTVFKGFPVFALGAVTLLILKLCGVGSFSWLWIPAVLFAPVLMFLAVMLIIIALVIAVAVVCGLIFLFAWTWDKCFNRRKNFW